MAMNIRGSPVRRLSTASSVSRPPHFILTTQWLWYWKDESGQWQEYGQVSDMSLFKSFVLIFDGKIQILQILLSALLFFFRTMLRGHLSLRKLWRTCSWLTRMYKFHLLLTNISMFSTSKEEQVSLKCIKRTSNLRRRGKSDGDHALCLFKM